MTPDAQLNCRKVLDRFLAQVLHHLPNADHTYGMQLPPDSVVPLDRLPMLGQTVQQYIEAEAVFAQANGQADAE
jgi:hypothetical protein